MKMLNTEWGPLVEYDGQVVRVEDINPHQIMRWRLSRLELLAFGLKTVCAALFAGRIR